MEVSTKI